MDDLDLVDSAFVVTVLSREPAHWARGPNRVEILTSAVVRDSVGHYDEQTAVTSAWLLSRVRVPSRSVTQGSCRLSRPTGVIAL
jgi:hypothetical protein